MLLRLVLIFFLSCLLPLQAGAETPQKGSTFSILPFTLHGSSNWRYLQDAIPEMLKSRLTWPEHFTPIDANKDMTAKAVTITADNADSIRKQLGTDYLIWGALSIVGEKCSLDITMLGPKGKQQPFSSTCDVNNLIPHLEEVARQINADIFSRPQAEIITVAPTQPEQKPMPHNQGLLYNEMTTETAINPGLRYEGDPRGDHRWRSQSLNFPSRGMVVGDADGDGQKEIFLLKERGVAVFHLSEHRLVPIDDYSLGLRYECLNINLIPQGNGKAKIAISATMENKPTSFILSFAGGKIEALHERLPYFLNVLKEPPLYQPILFGQKLGITRFLDNNGIVELTVTDQAVLPGRTLKLPETGNIFNVVFLPEKEDYRIIVADRRDKLKVYTSSHQLMATTDETFAASGTSILYDTTFAGGTPHDSNNMKNYFIPTRLEVYNIDGDKKNELLVSRNLSTAAQFFPRYRDFPQSEIHYLAWDGIGLNTLWKTRRIKGSTIDYTITDLSQKGQQELLVCVNTHPGSLGVRDKKTILLAYPLEIKD